jgi:hypothetical protein
MLATDISASECLSYWVNSVASTGIFVKNPEATWNVIGVHGVPAGWTVISNSESGGGSNINFPVTLIQGDNGELGINLYNYLISVLPENTSVSCPNDEYGIGEIILQGFGNANMIRVMAQSENIKNIFITNPMMSEEALTLTLHSNGYYI